AGWFQLPYSAGSAGAIQSGIRFLAIDRGGPTYPDTGRDGGLVDASSGRSLLSRWATQCTAGQCLYCCDYPAGRILKGLQGNAQKLAQLCATSCAVSCDRVHSSLAGLTRLLVTY